MDTFERKLQKLAEKPTLKRTSLPRCRIDIGRQRDRRTGDLGRHRFLFGVALPGMEGKSDGMVTVVTDRGRIIQQARDTVTFAS